MRESHDMIHMIVWRPRAWDIKLEGEVFKWSGIIFPILRSLLLWPFFGQSRSSVMPISTRVLEGLACICIDLDEEAMIFDKSKWVCEDRNAHSCGKWAYCVKAFFWECFRCQSIWTRGTKREEELEMFWRTLRRLFQNLRLCHSKMPRGNTRQNTAKEPAHCQQMKTSHRWLQYNWDETALETMKPNAFAPLYTVCFLCNLTKLFTYEKGGSQKG